MILDLAVDDDYPKRRPGEQPGLADCDRTTHPAETLERAPEPIHLEDRSLFSRSLKRSPSVVITALGMRTGQSYNRLDTRNPTPPV